MGTSLENCLTNFDFDLLFGPASSLDSVSTETPHATGIFDHGGGQIIPSEQTKTYINCDAEIRKIKNDNITFKNKCEKLEAENVKLKGEFNGLKESYKKLASDYEELHKDSRDHALAAISNSNKLENMKLEVERHNVALNEQKEQCIQYDWTVQGLQSHIRQLESLIMEFQNKNEDLKKCLNTERLNVKAGRKMITSLNSSVEILTDNLCIFGCVIGGGRELDKDIKRLLKKYCKKSTPDRKKSIDADEFHSIDTGRGSSLAFSDCERSNCSPAYSANLSPMSICPSVNCELIGITRHVMASPSPKTTAMDISTSPIIFETMTNLETCEVGTNTITDQAASVKVCEAYTNTLPVLPDTRTPVVSITTCDASTSPIPFKEEPKPPTSFVKMHEVGTNTVSILSEEETKITCEIGTSPIPFEKEVKTQIASIKTRQVGTNTTPPKEVKNPLGTKKSRHVGTSPMRIQKYTKSSEATVQTCDVATSPIPFVNNSQEDLRKSNTGSGTIFIENNKRSATATTKSDIVTFTEEESNSPTTDNYNEDMEDRKANPWFEDFNLDDTDDEETYPASHCKKTDQITGMNSIITSNKISKCLKEIESQQLVSSSLGDKNDLEIQMILKTQRLNWDILSPMSLTPELEMNKQNHDSLQEINDMNCESDAFDEMLHIHENAESYVERNDTNQKNDENESTRILEDLEAKKCPISQPVVLDSADIVPTKSNCAFKNKKLSNLQKLYNSNVAKSKIKSEIPPSRKQLRPKPITIAPVKYSLEALSFNKEKAVRIMAEHKAKLMQSNTSDQAVKVSKVSMDCSPMCEPMSSPSAESSSKHELSEKNNNEHETKTLSSKEVKSSSKDLLEIENTRVSLPKSNISKFDPTKVKPIPRKRVHASTESLLNVSTSAARKIADPSVTSLHNNNKEVYEPRNDLQPLPRRSLSNTTSTLRADLSVAALPIRERETITTYHPALNVPVTGSLTQSVDTGDRESSDVLSKNCDSLKAPLPKKIRTSNDEVITDGFVLPSIPQQDNINIRNLSEDAANNNDPRLVGNSGYSHKPSVKRKMDDSNLVAAPEELRHRTNYNDINMFTADSIGIENKRNDVMLDDSMMKMRNNLLSISLDKYASYTVARPMKPQNEKKETLRLHELIAKKISDGIAKCATSREAHGECKAAMSELVSTLMQDNRNNIICGLVKYLNDPTHVKELHNKFGKAHKPCMAQTEKLLINLMQDMQRSQMDIVDETLDVIECTMFSLEKGATPGFEVIESMSHFFSVICKIFKKMSRLMMFMLNALYCISFKAMVLVKQCLDVCPNVLPYGNMETAKIPLIRCFVFMLHFYTCNDPFKRVQELRDRLRNEYQYNLQDENETTILYMFKTTICMLSENKIEKEMLRICLIVLAKRRGTKWCHKNLIQKIILPMVKGETEVTSIARRFCIRLLGPLMKPYKNEMMVHCEEVVNVLIKLLKESQSQETKEDILSSLICMNVQSTWVPVNKYLLNWTSPSTVSPEFEAVLRRYIRSKHLNTWRQFYRNHFNER